MIYLELLISFLKIGLFSFGGAYGAIPLIQDVAADNGWADPAMFANLVALSESTPGPIMVNMAAYIGSRQAGLGGAVLATAGVIFPSFVILLLVTILFRDLLKHTYIQAVLMGIKPCLMGVILATGVYMIINICFGTEGRGAFHGKACLIFLFLTAVNWGYYYKRKSEFSPILLILLAAVCGSIFL